MGTSDKAGSAKVVRTAWEFRTAPDEPPVRGEVRIAEGAAPTSAVVLCQGFKGFKDWAFFPVLARALALRGHAAVSFNLSRSGVGDDGVDFSALELFADQTHARNVTEIRAVLEAVREGGIVPGVIRAMGLFGHSRGGGEAVLAAAADRRIDALVTWSAISTVDRWSEEQKATWERGDRVLIPNARTRQQMPVGPGYWRDLRENRDRLDITSAAATLDVPWLIVHGEEDETVPSSEGRLLRRAAGDSAELLLLAGTGHTFGASHPCEEVSPALDGALQVTTSWFDTHLAGK
jgi:uncharacterized protein